MGQVFGDIDSALTPEVVDCATVGRLRGMDRSRSSKHTGLLLEG